MRKRTIKFARAATIPTDTDRPDLCHKGRRLSIQWKPEAAGGWGHMLTLFAAMGLLQRKGKNIRLTDLAQEHLVEASPWCIGPYFASVKERPGLPGHG